MDNQSLAEQLLAGKTPKTQSEKLTNARHTVNGMAEETGDDLLKMIADLLDYADHRLKTGKRDWKAAEAALRTFQKAR